MGLSAVSKTWAGTLNRPFGWIVGCAHRLISVHVRVSDTHRTLVIAAKADREVRDKRACQGSRHARNAYNGVKDEPRHALISVPAKVSGTPVKRACEGF